ncbi:MAG: ATP synthase F1 subunit gamma, partial [Ignavibacteria bacterium]
MATLREIKRRIVGVKSTQQITKAMKMVAAARLRRAQENIINARPYSRKISEVLGHLLSLEKNIENPLLEKREVNSLAVVLLTSDRGLCGSFNMTAIRHAEDLIKIDYKELYDTGKVQLYCVGKKGHDYFKTRPFNIAGYYNGIFSNLDFSFASTLTSELSSKFVNGEVDKVVIIYNQFKSVIQQVLTTEQLLPV